MTEVEVDEVLGFVGDVGAEVTADDAVPSGVVLLVELLLDVGGDVLFDVELFHGLGGDFGGVGLHVFGHVSVLDDGLAISGHFFLLKVTLTFFIAKCKNVELCIVKNSQIICKPHPQRSVKVFS